MARVIRRRARRQSSTIPQIAIAGYTNAGKSSLINAITGAGVLAEDALFATLDPTTRRAELGDGRAVVFTDTVGFVRHLPTQLVEAFKSTLEEVLAADLMLHVVDESDPFPLKQIEAVNKVIYDIVTETGEEAPPEIIVINKIDRADPLVLAEVHHVLDRDNVVYVSAHTGEGIDELTVRVELFLNSLDQHVCMRVPFTRGDVVSRVHSEGTVRNEEYTEDGTLLEVRLPAAVVHELAAFVIGAPPTARILAPPTRNRGNLQGKRSFGASVPDQLACWRRYSGNTPCWPVWKRLPHPR